MTPENREELRRMLEERAREILSRTHASVVRANEAMEVRGDVLDANEEAIEDAIKSAGADMSERDRVVLVSIREALRRYADGSYGVCIECGEAIDLARLRSIPWAARCAADQEREEEDRRAPSPPTL